jgi:hypothetical protein
MHNLASPSPIAQPNSESFSLLYDATEAAIAFARWLLAEKTNLSPKKFSALLAANQMPRSTANKYLKIAIAFAEFPTDQIKRMGILDLEKYAANRFTEFRSSLIDLTELTCTAVADLARDFSKGKAAKQANWLTFYLTMLLKTYTPPQSEEELGTVVGDNLGLGGQLPDETGGHSSQNPTRINIWKRDAQGKRYWEIGKCIDPDAGAALQKMVETTGKLPQTITSLAILKLFKEENPAVISPAPLPPCPSAPPPPPPAHPDDTWQQAQNELETYLKTQGQQTEEIEQLKREIAKLESAIALRESEKAKASEVGQMYCPTQAMILRIDRTELANKQLRLRELEFLLPVKVLAYA